MHYSYLKNAIIVLLSIWLCSCVTNVPLQVDESYSSSPVDNSKSRIVFLRSHAFIAGGKIPAVLFHLSENDEKLISPILNKTKVIYDLEPGKHLFMVNSDEAVDFMAAELLPGKTYYVLVRPFPGAMTYRFSFAPIRKSPQSEFNITQDRFTKWLKSTKTVTETADTDLWYQQQKEQIREKRKTFWPEWKSKPEHQRLSQTLNKDDGN